MERETLSEGLRERGTDGPEEREEGGRTTSACAVIVPNEFQNRDDSNDTNFRREMEVKPPRAAASTPSSSAGEEDEEMLPCEAGNQNHFTPDVLRMVIEFVDFPTRLAALCVCQEWKEAVLDSSVWRKICVPKYLACRLWDNEFEPLIKKAQGQLSVLQVASTGITARSLLAFSRENAAGPFLEELRFDRCANLAGIDIVHFVEAITSRPGGPRIGHLAIEGCSHLSHHDVFRLNQRVASLDVGICVCLRVEVLEKCESRHCQGLCRHCAELYRGCGLHCGSCNQPQNSQQALRVRVHRWNTELIAALRTRWKDVRHGIV